MASISCLSLRGWIASPRAVRRALLAGLLVLGATSSHAQPAVRQVLMLQSLDRGNLPLDHFTGSFRVELDQRYEQPVNVVQVVVGPTGSVGAPEHAIVDFIQSTFANQPKPGLIVATGGLAANFARKYRQEIFPEVPLLFASVDRRFLADPLGTNETAVAVVNDFPHIVDQLMQLLPQTRQVFMVMGSGQFGQFWRPELETGFKRFNGRPTFIWSDSLSLAEMLHRSASLPSDAVIYYVTFGTDAAGAAYADERVLTDLHAAASVPVFAAHTVYLGLGIVGGSLLDIDELSRNTAAVAVRLLNGEAPASVRLPPQSAGRPVFDWRELQRWGIAESRLPPGSVVVYRGPSLWREYRLMVLSAAGVLIVQSLSIAGLLYQRRARRRAEIESRRNLALAADAGRRQTMSALTNSITHELGQPLASMIHNAKALQMMINANRAPADAVGEILSDIQNQGVQATQIIERHRAMLRGHQFDRKPIDLHTLMKDSLALVAHDLRSRGIESVIDVAPDPRVIMGDEVLLKQVLVNLVVNAADAMAGTPPGRRAVTVRSECRAADVRISVRDTGTGLPTELDGNLFTPFATTKSHGLGIGLTIVRTIVDAHGGTIDAHNNPDGGATFTVTLPRAEPIAMPSGPEGAV